MPEPDPADIARSIETFITWWSPGQYVPLGLLVSAGLSLGSAMVLLAAMAAVASSWGTVSLASELGAPARSLPWIAIGVAASWHTFYSFGTFIGGEVALIAIWPWVALAAWRLRERPILLTLGLPPLLLLGSWAKHSFAIFGLGLLVFIWLERWRVRPRSWRGGIAATCPLLAAGLLYLLTRAVLLDQGGPSPADAGQVPRGMVESWGFAAWGSLFAATGLGSLGGRWFFLQGWETDAGWARLGPWLALSAPAALALYLKLAGNPRPLERLAGICAGVTAVVLGLLYARGGSISFDDRHFRAAGVLLIAVAANLTQSARPWIGRFARLSLIVVVAYGAATALHRHHRMRTELHRTIAGNSIPDLSPAVQRVLLDFVGDGASGSSLVVLPTPAAATVLPPDRRIMATDAQDRDQAWLARQERRGRVSRLLIALPDYMEHDGRGAVMRASFADYPGTAWTISRVGGWTFAEAHEAAATGSP